MNYVKNLREKIGHAPVILVGAVTVVTNNGNQILLQQRRVPYGKWGLPGGLMELEESTEDAARREVLEETGLILDELELINILSGKKYFITAQNGDEFYSVTVAYHSKNPKGELVIDQEESLDFQYFEIDELPDEIVGSHKEIIDSYLEKYPYQK